MSYHASAALQGAVYQALREDEALGELVGEPHRGLEYMFSMMNHARLNVGLQGLAIAERFRALARSLSERTIVTVTPGTTAREVAARASAVPTPRIPCGG